MARKDNKNNPLNLEIRPTPDTKARLKKRVSSRKYFETLLNRINQRLNSGTADELPSGWDVRISWKNPNTKVGVTRGWREDDFISAINESREGFAVIAGAVIGRALSREKAKVLRK